MTWNVQNLLAVGHPSGPGSVAELTAKVAALAAVIDRGRPHVLALQEVGEASELAQLQRALSWSMPYRALGVPDDRGIRVAFLSTRVIRDAIDVTVYPPGLLPVQVGDDPFGAAGPETMNQIGRGALQIGIRSNHRIVRLLTCHLKSKLLTYPGGRFFPIDEDERARYGAYALFRRAAEAATIRIWVTAQLAGRGADDPFVVLGDMNDVREAATTQILNGPTGSEIGTRGFDVPDRGDGERLWNLAPLIPEAERVSRVYRGRGELIDHVFVSRFLVGVDRIPEVRTIQARGGPLPSIHDDPRDDPNGLGSDHAAILATFDDW